MHQEETRRSVRLEGDERCGERQSRHAWGRWGVCRGGEVDGGRAWRGSACGVQPLTGTGCAAPRDGCGVHRGRGVQRRVRLVVRRAVRGVFVCMCVGRAGQPRREPGRRRVSGRSRVRRPAPRPRHALKRGTRRAPPRRPPRRARRVYTRNNKRFTDFRHSVRHLAGSAPVATLRAGALQKAGACGRPRRATRRRGARGHAQR